MRTILFIGAIVLCSIQYTVGQKLKEYQYKREIDASGFFVTTSSAPGQQDGHLGRGFSLRYTQYNGKGQGLKTGISIADFQGSDFHMEIPVYYSYKLKDKLKYNSDYDEYYDYCGLGDLLFQLITPKTIEVHGGFGFKYMHQGNKYDPDYGDNKYHHEYYYAKRPFDISFDLGVRFSYDLNPVLIFISPELSFPLLRSYRFYESQYDTDAYSPPVYVRVHMGVCYLF